MQTGILLIVCFVGDFSEMSQSKVGDLDRPTTVQQTVTALQTTVKFQRTLVNILHSLCTQDHTERLESMRLLSTGVVVGQRHS